MWGRLRHILGRSVPTTLPRTGPHPIAMHCPSWPPGFGHPQGHRKASAQLSPPARSPLMVPLPLPMPLAPCPIGDQRGRKHRGQGHADTGRAKGAGGVGGAPGPWPTSPWQTLQSGHPDEHPGGRQAGAAEDDLEGGDPGPTPREDGRQ